MKTNGKEMENENDDKHNLNSCAPSYDSVMCYNAPCLT